MKLVGKTDVGFSRANNQDAYCGGKLGGNTIWAVVCDGMGGANGGEVASNIAIQALEEDLMQALPMKKTESEIKDLLLTSIERANKKIQDKARASVNLRGMGTTLVSAVVKDNTIHLAHAGDSRIYLFRNNTLTRVTKDHSMVQELIDTNMITEEEARMHPQKNMITRVLGIEPTVNAEYNAFSAHNKDLLLLCTDGLTSVLTDHEIEKILQKNYPFFDTANVLVRTALMKSTQDNVTAVLLQTNFVPEE